VLDRIFGAAQAYIIGKRKLSFAMAWRFAWCL